jgi:hypothetical protein
MAIRTGSDKPRVIRGRAAAPLRQTRVSLKPPADNHGDDAGAVAMGYADSGSNISLTSMVAELQELRSSVVTIEGNLTKIDGKLNLGEMIKGPEEQSSLSRMQDTISSLGEHIRFLHERILAMM